MPPAAFGDACTLWAIGLRRLNPFRGLSNPREVWAWGMFDLANQSFTLLIITVLFSLYFKNLVTESALQRGLELEQAGNRGDFVWSLVHGSSYLVVVLLSPLLGAAADARSWRKEILLLTGCLCAVLTVALGLVPPSLLIVLAIAYFVANVAYQLGENFLASFLPDISTPKNIGRISATGWTMGYVGALLLLVLVLGLMLLLGWRDPSRWRPFFALAGIWFLAGMVPAALFLYERKRTTTIRGNLVSESVRRVFATLRHSSKYRHLALFLTAFLVYGFGVQVVIGFASIIGARFGIKDEQLVLFVLQITVTAGIAAIATAMFQDRIGAKRTVQIYLVVWIASALALTILSTRKGGSSMPLWIIGNGLGFGLGGIGTASRSMVGLFAPRHRAAEFFGLWGLTYKLAAAIGVLTFGAVTELTGDVGAMMLLTGFFVVGFLLMIPVSEQKGIEAARAAEREEGISDGASNAPGAFPAGHRLDEIDAAPPS